jgi:hypothetical protein
VDYNLKRLEERGLLRRDREISRDPAAGRQNRRAMTVRCLARSPPASRSRPRPRCSPEGYEEVEAAEDQVSGRANAFALKVEGTSDDRRADQ